MRKLPAKVTRPTSHGAYPRARIYALLDAVADQPAAWVVSPPGAGKTTIATGYIDDRDLTNLWYQVDESDSDIAGLFYYLGRAAERFNGEDGNSLPLFTAEYAMGLNTFARRFFEQLFDHLRPPFALVLDNYQLAPHDAQLHDVLVTAIETLPAGGRIFILSREAPPANFARLQTNEKLVTIDWEDLQLRSEEVKGVVELRAPANSSPEYLRKLDALSHGWMAGLILLLRSSPGELDQIEVVDHQISPLMFNYFAGEILGQQDKDSQEFLMQAALFVKVTATLAVALTGNPQAGTILQRLHESNYFTEYHGNSSPHYQFHPLFRDFLLARLAETRTADALIDLHCRAAALLASANQADAAVPLYLEAGNWNAASGLICQLAPGLLAEGRGQSLQQWIDRLPATCSTENPWIGYWSGCALLFLSPIGARRQLEQSYSAFKQGDDTAGLLLTWSAVVNSHVLEWNQTALLNEWIDEGDRLLEEYPEFPSPDVEAQFLSSMVSALTLMRPDHPRLLAMADQVMDLIRVKHDPDFATLAGIQLIHYFCWTGKIGRAESLATAVRAVVDTTNATTSNQVQALTIEAMTAWHLGDARRAIDLSRHGLAMAEASGSLVLMQNLFGARACAAIISGDEHLFANYAEESARFLPWSLEDSNFHVSARHWLISAILWLQGDLPGAVEQLRISRRAFLKVGEPPLVCGFLHSAEAILHFEMNDIASAQRSLDQLARVARENDSVIHQYHGQLIEAGFALERGDEPACLSAARQAFRLAREHALTTTAWWDAKRNARICAKALEHGIESDYVIGLIRKLELPPDLDTDVVDAWPWPVSIQAVGRFRVEVNGAVVDAGPKGQKKVIELLQALIAFGTQAVSAERLADALWPDADADAARGSLRTAIYRLRALLAHPDAVVVNAGDLSLNRRVCRVDVDVFGRLLNEDTDEIPRRIRLQRAIALYQGALLDGVDTVWALSPRERLRQQFLRAVTELGGYLEADNEWAQAIELFERGLAVDALAEPFYARLMRCHRELGQSAQALVAFQRCRDALERQFGVAPSEPLRKLADSMR